MNEESVVILTEPIIEPVVEPEAAPQVRLLSRVYIKPLGGGDKYWGTVASLSRTRFTLFTHARFKMNARVAVEFHFQISDKFVVAEKLEARAIWQGGDSAALEFNPPLTAGSPVSKVAPHLEAHLAKQEARR